MPVTILAIESSCDDTSAAICQNGKMLSNCVANQSIHERYGGVVPELAGNLDWINAGLLLHNLPDLLDPF